MQITRKTALISCIILIMILITSPAIAANSTAEAFVDKGVQEAKQQKCDDAIISFDNALQIDPDYALAWYNRGLCLNNLGRKNESLISFDKALQTKDLQELNNKSDTYLAGQVWINRGVVLYDVGRYEESVASYDEVLKINPRDADAWTNRGTSLTRLGRYDEAIESYDSALKLDSAYPQIVQHNRELALAEQKNATLPHQQIQSTSQSIPSQQQIQTTSLTQPPQQQTQKSPLIFAPISAIALMIALSVWRRR